MTADEAVAALDAIVHGDNEAAHGEADDVLRASVDPAVREAYDRCRGRIGFWYA